MRRPLPLELPAHPDSTYQLGRPPARSNRGPVPLEREKKPGPTVWPSSMTVGGGSNGTLTPTAIGERYCPDTRSRQFLVGSESSRSDQRAYRPTVVLVETRDTVTAERSASTTGPGLAARLWSGGDRFADYWTPVSHVLSGANSRFLSGVQSDAGRFADERTSRNRRLRFDVDRRAHDRGASLSKQLE